jgi:hypothetical protein
MQHFAQIASSKLASAMESFNAVAAASAYKSLSRVGSPEIAALALVHCAIESALARDPEIETSEFSYAGNDIERICRLGWTRQERAFGFAFDVGSVVGQKADVLLADAPFAIIDRIAGISRLPRRLDDEELLEFTRALCSVGAAMHCASEHDIALDYARLASGLSEWLVAKDGKILLAPWTSTQYSWNGSEHVGDFWNDPGPRQRGTQPKTKGPWSLSPALASALEAQALHSENVAAHLAKGKPKGL